MSTIKLKIYVDELANVLTLYDSIQVQRSITAPPAPTPVDLTDTEATSAEIIGTLEGPYIINGETFTLEVNGVEIIITFASPDPVSLLDIIDEINIAFETAELAALASDDGTGKLKLTTVDKGTQYTLEIVGGTALSILGFTAGAKDNGEAAYILLNASTTNYEFDDGSGDSSYYYRTRFYNTVSEIFSDWSDWIQGTTGAVIDSADLITAKVKLATLDGMALSGKKITIVNVSEPTIVNNFGIFGNAIDLETDSAGAAETPLVKGSLVDVIFSGTSIIRRIRVPSTGTEFDLLDSSLVEADSLEIMRPDLPYAPRRS